MVKNDLLDRRQLIILFIAGVTLCALFFTFGLFVGKWSAQGPDAATRLGSSRSPAPTGQERAQAPRAQRESVAGGLVSASSADTASTSLPADRPGPSAPADASGKPAESAASAVPSDSSRGAASSNAGAASSPTQQGVARNFSVRAGAFDQAQEAEALARTLRSRGFVSAYTEKQLSESGAPRFVVMLGPWVDRESAVRTMNELRNQGLSNVTIIGQP
ncbi:MAG: SPOR domain-containing protein [Acidobacteriota bacterium]|nr:SPOR domain-containing protein [Blastocatellia bacterium]MDW8240844.1 SPOR domain-containing protein [Acidobacteriota bacterium]